MLDLKDYDIKMFRCHVTPAIGPTHQLAYSVNDENLKTIAFEVDFVQFSGQTVGIMTKWLDRRNKDKETINLVFATNIQSMELTHKDTGEVITLKPRIGRPPKDA